MATTPTIQSYQPNLQGKVHPAAAQAISLLFSAIQDHDTAIVALNGKVTTPASTTSTTSTSTASATPAASSSSFPYLGGVNLQTGTSYGVQLTDNGVLLVMSNAAAMVVTLTSTVTAPFFMSLLNLGGASATLTPSTGLVNSQASITVLSAGWAILYFDGTNWWTMDSPPLATSTTFGLVKPDNTTITIVNGVISSVGGGVSGPTVTTNANGTCVAFGTSWVHQFGTIGPTTTGVGRTTIAVSFPVTFAGIPNVNCQPTNNPDSYGTAVFDCYPTNITALGFEVNLTCGVTIGGGGPADISNPTYVDWKADYA